MLHRSDVTRSLLILLLLLSACTAPQYRIINENRGDLPARAAVEGVPFYAQEDFYCGPAALAMALTWAGIPSTQEAIAKQVYTPGREGTLPIDILTGARRNGALTVPVNSLQDLLAEIAAGHPVLVFQNLGLKLLPQWHFAVAIEYDLTEDVIILHSGLNERHVTDVHAFEQTWKRADYWAVTVTQPYDLPARAGQESVLEAAAGLERAGKYEAATTAYTTIAERWPNNVTARIGLGNAFYALGNYKKSETAFRNALAIDPNNAPAWNNLAYVLAKLNRRHESIQAARQAVIVSGGKDEAYRQTLREIRNAETKP